MFTNIISNPSHNNLSPFNTSVLENNLLDSIEQARLHTDATLYQKTLNAEENSNKAKSFYQCVLKKINRFSSTGKSKKRKAIRLNENATYGSQSKTNVTLEKLSQSNTTLTDPIEYFSKAKDILYLIFDHLDFKSLRFCCRVNKLWHQTVTSKSIWYRMVFKNAMPYKNNLNLPAGSIPQIVLDLLKQPCPFSKDKEVKIGNTHALIFFEKKNKDLRFSKICSRASVHQAIKDKHRNDYVEKSYWGVIYKGVIPGSTNKDYKEAESLIQRLNEKNHLNYDMSTVLEISTVFKLYNNYLNELLFVTNYTFCKKQEEDDQSIIANCMVGNILAIRYADMWSPKDRTGTTVIHRFFDT